MSKSKRKQGNVARRPGQQQQQQPKDNRPQVRKPSDIIAGFTHDINEIRIEVSRISQFITINRNLVSKNTALPEELVASYDSMAERIGNAKTIVDELLRVAAKMEEVESVSAQVELFIENQDNIIPVYSILQEVGNELNATAMQVSTLMKKAQMEQAIIDQRAPDASPMFDPIAHVESLAEQALADHAEPEVQVSPDTATSADDILPSADGQDGDPLPPLDAPSDTPVAETPQV